MQKQEETLEKERKGKFERESRKRDSAVMAGQWVKTLRKSPKTVATGGCKTCLGVPVQMSSESVSHQCKPEKCTGAKHSFCNQLW